MNEAPGTEELLIEIRDIQREVLELAREQHAMVSRQFERAEALHERAEKIQEKSETMVAAAKRAMVFILPVIAVLLAYLTWLIFR